MIQCECPHCDYAYQVDDNYAGKALRTSQIAEIPIALDLPPDVALFGCRQRRRRKHLALRSGRSRDGFSGASGQDGATQHAQQDAAKSARGYCITWSGRKRRTMVS